MVEYIYIYRTMGPWVNILKIVQEDTLMQVCGIGFATRFSP